MTERVQWRLQFETESHQTLVVGNEMLQRLEDGRCQHTIRSPWDERRYRELAAEAERKGAVNVRLGKRTVVTTYGEWEDG